MLQSHPSGMCLVLETQSQWSWCQTDQDVVRGLWGWSRWWQFCWRWRWCMMMMLKDAAWWWCYRPFKKDLLSFPLAFVVQNEPSRSDRSNRSIRCLRKIYRRSDQRRHFETAASTDWGGFKQYMGLWHILTTRIKLYNITRLWLEYIL